MRLYQYARWIKFRERHEIAIILTIIIVTLLQFIIIYDYTRKLLFKIQINNQRLSYVLY